MSQNTRDGNQISKNLPDFDKGPYWRLILGQGYCTPAVNLYRYLGSGTIEEPHVVGWLDRDSRNPYKWSLIKRAVITSFISSSSFAASFSPSAYTGSTVQIAQDFNVSTEVATLGLSLFVLGFAVGPLIFGPLCELYGRQVVFVVTYGALAVLNAGAAVAPNIQSLLVIRFFAGAFGSSPLTNAGGQIADMYGPNLVGLAMSLFIIAPFIGPAVGPISGGFIADTGGWRWVERFLALLTGVIWLLGCVVVPETYAPTLLKKRAEKLSSKTGKIYKSRLEVEKGGKSVKEVFSKALGRPWLLLFMEPIVLLLAVYMAIVYGTLYMFFSAFPIVFQEHRQWNEGEGGLAFIGVAVGMTAGALYAIPENIRYNKLIRKAEGRPVPPEERLVPAMVGTPWIPIGPFWFAFTSTPNSIPAPIPIAAGVPFGFGMVTTYLAIANYLIDGYTIYAASALAANSLLRSLFGTAFPLFAEPMYHNLGVRWASCIPAFLALACVPAPFLLYKYGHAIRQRCKYAAEAERVRMMVQQKQESANNDGAVVLEGHKSKECGARLGGEDTLTAATPTKKLEC